MVYEKGTKIRHRRTGVIETIVGKCKIKLLGVWVDGVIYEGPDRYTGELTTFVRTRNEFNDEFELIDNNE
jgi:hypothetical protein